MISAKLQFHSKNAKFGFVSRNIASPCPQLCARLKCCLQRKSKFLLMNLILSGVSLLLRAVVPAEAICEMVSRWQESLIPPSKWEGGRMPVPVSEITVTFSMPGFLLLGRQDLWAALPRNFNSLPDLNPCCQSGCCWLPVLQISELSAAYSAVRGTYPLMSQILQPRWCR